jgi:putative AdoMet-dependent methyltransferase
MINSACHDDQADFYDAKVKNDQNNEFYYIRENYDEIHRLAIKKLNLVKSDKLLDIGIGTGLLEEKITDEISIYGIDISEKMLAKVREKKLKVELKKGSFIDIPYPDKFFNKVVTCFVFHHLDNDEKNQAIKEIFRVMTTKGAFVIADFMYLNPLEHQNQRKWFLDNNRSDMIEEMDDENFTNIEWLNEIANKNGREIDVIKGSTICWVVKLS